MSRITIGIPCYGDPVFETWQDYIRFAYYLGRRCPEHDFALAIKSKSEQFRARNSIIEASLQWGADYILFLDDDHIIDWEAGGCYVPEQVNSRYGFVSKLVDHLKADPKRGIVGCLYYHRGGECLNVLMKEGNDGGFYYLRDDEIKNELQEVDVQGGGCMLINTNIFSLIPSPWFVAESEAGIGTDMQICNKTRAHGFSIWSDTSIVLGHVLDAREVVTPKNRQRIIGDTGAKEAITRGIDSKWSAKSAMVLYQQDGEEYLQLSQNDILDLANCYGDKNMTRFDDYEDKIEYYKSLGSEQLARQLWFHGIPERLEEHENFWNRIDATRPFYGLDYGCGSAPIGFEMVLRGHRMDFVDIDGTPAYEFTKWRAKHRNVEDQCGWKLSHGYDYVLMMDAIEHIPNWESVLFKIIMSMKPNATLFTNYFFNTDYDNIEHVSMEHMKVQKFLTDHKIYPVNHTTWVNRDLDFMNVKASAA